MTEAITSYSASPRLPQELIVAKIASWNELFDRSNVTVAIRNDAIDELDEMWTYHDEPCLVDGLGIVTSLTAANEAYQRGYAADSETLISNGFDVVLCRQGDTIRWRAMYAFDRPERTVADLADIQLAMHPQHTSITPIGQLYDVLHP